MQYPTCVNWNNRFYVSEGRNRRLKIEVICPDCKQSRFMDRRNLDRLIKTGNVTGRCRHCNARLHGDKSGGWRGGRHLGSSGRYVYITVQPDHDFICMANCRNEIAEHRLIMARQLGRPLHRNEHVHHLDGNKTNNCPENLIVMSAYEHLRIEGLIRYGRIKREEVGEYANAIGA